LAARASRFQIAGISGGLVLIIVIALLLFYSRETGGDEAPQSTTISIEESLEDFSSSSVAEDSDPIVQTNGY
jgi:hypothetical protein